MTESVKLVGDILTGLVIFVLTFTIIYGLVHKNDAIEQPNNNCQDEDDKWLFPQNIADGIEGTYTTDPAFRTYARHDKYR